MNKIWSASGDSLSNSAAGNYKPPPIKLLPQHGTETAAEKLNSLRSPNIGALMASCQGIIDGATTQSQFRPPKCDYKKTTYLSGLLSWNNNHSLKTDFSENSQFTSEILTHKYVFSSIQFVSSQRVEKQGVEIRSETRSNKEKTERKWRKNKVRSNEEKKKRKMTNNFQVHFLLN